jgi:predicted lipoprotein with Yx(FWY)xxD motif
VRPAGGGAAQPQIRPGGRRVLTQDQLTKGVILRRTLLYALTGAISLCVVSASVAAAAPLVRTAHNAKLKANVLVARNGHTLYDLSVERKGRFICDTKFCLSLWTPLVVAKGTKPIGSVALATIERPDGHLQVTFHGAPLYTFNEDAKPGDAKGEGFKDVGTWHAATVGVKAAAVTTTGGGYTYP